MALQTTIRLLLSLDPTKRPIARAILASPFIESGPIKTLRMLQSLVGFEPVVQAKFLTTLPKAIDGFSPRVLRDMVIPGLHLVVTNKAMSPFVITLLLKIVFKVDKQMFSHSVASIVILLLAITEPVQCMLVIRVRTRDAHPKDRGRLHSWPHCSHAVPGTR
uniref:Uncharacterized protein n=1 Tax=Peronospora matthiolae TaxID=2874970 RepID=A0AAV1T8K8_9STRA